ncbi:signal peptidase I [Sneathiella chinensis]|uniref:Signal peptidase I n=1 Tax=Sneathiella chinensis TaxID=349750 RepID=A0ABQ5U841_9PROT|nr:signal peptidase I [Sneathiella chinensis]GLQ07360.1 signal peptidase I [Sneathiella chinensis]
MKEDVVKDERWLGETIRTVVYAVLIAMVIRTFAFEPFKIPSESMLPTLKIGDYLFVSKYSYGFSKHSFPFSMGPFDGRILEDLPERGDVAVFKKPKGEPIDYIKRIMGLPGDKLQMIDGVLYINGTAVKRERVEDYVDRDFYGNFRRIAQYKETLPSGKTYMTLDMVRNGSADNTEVFTVPAGHLFAMGDNRDNSTDSRFLSQVGYIPVENLVGRAEIIFMSLEGDTSFLEIWKVPFAARWDRVFDSLN